ncbi:MAG: GH25 family lysozyme [Pseudomonadota bacterium]
MRLVCLACLILLTACGGGSGLVYGDHDPYDWGRRAPNDYDVHGLDVSRWQGEVDWRAVARAGVAFTFIKATEGGDHTDPMFEAHWTGAGRAGIARGAYHYYYFCRTPEEQAEWFMAHVPRSANALPHVLDLEWTPTSRTCPYRPEGAVIQAAADRFLDILESHYGRRPIVYTTPDFYRETGIGRLRGTEFWLRSVAGHPSETYRGAAWTFWQYTGTGIVPGVDGPVDINAFNGSPAEWDRWR